MDGGVCGVTLGDGGLGVCEGRDHMGSRLGEGTGVGAHGWFDFYFVLRGFCWGCLSRGGEGAGLLDGFVSRWPCGHHTVAHHVLNCRLR